MRDPPTPTFAQELVDVLTLDAGVNTTWVVAGATLLGLAAGVVGVFALLRKRSLVTDAVSHATLPGIAVAFLLAPLIGLDGRSLPVLMLGAAATGVLGAVSIHLLTRFSRLREDAAIGIVLSVFFGAGIVALSIVQKHAPEGAGGINAFIFGQAAAMQPGEVRVSAVVALAAALAAALLFKEFRIVCFNEEYARATGWPVNALDLTMTALAVAVTVAGLQAVGIIMVVALLIIPPVAARFWTDRLGPLVVIAGAIGAASGYLGSAVSALTPNAPAGAVIVLTSAAFFVVSFLAAPARGVLATILRRIGLRVRLAGDHLLERVHELGGAAPAVEVDRLAHARGWTPLFRRLVLATLRHARRIEVSDDGAVRARPAGRERGARVARNHALWSRYLIDHADVAPSHVEWSVDQVEHVLDDEIIRELERRVERDRTDPRRSPPA